MVKACGYNWRDVISSVSQSEVQKSCWWANKAIIRERHPIPTIDEIIKDVREGNIFSKSDLKWSYHQIQLRIHVAWKRSVTYKGMLFEREWCLASPLLQRNISKSFKKCWNIVVEWPTFQMTSSSMVLTELNMKATGESAHKIEGQGPFSYQGEIYNLFAKVHIYCMAWYYDNVQDIGPMEGKVEALKPREPQNRQRLRVF